MDMELFGKKNVPKLKSFKRKQNTVPTYLTKTIQNLFYRTNLITYLTKIIQNLLYRTNLITYLT